MLAALTVVLSLAFWGGVSKRFPARAPLSAPAAQGRAAGTVPGFVPAIWQGDGIPRQSSRAVAGSEHHLGGADFGVGRRTAPEHSLHGLLLIVPIILCISSLPITPNGLGVRENLFVLMLAVIAVPSTAALSLSLLASAEGIFWSLIGGLVYMGLRENEPLSEVTRGDDGRKQLNLRVFIHHHTLPAPATLLIHRSGKPATWQQVLIINDSAGNKIGNRPATDPLR